MRTNIEIDDDLMQEAMKLAGTTTKRETVELALRELVDRYQRLEFLDLWKSVNWTGDLNEMRRGRTWSS